MITDALSADVVAIVRNVVLHDMGRFGATLVDVAVEPDHDGDSSLKIDISYDGRGDPVDPKIMAGLLSKLRDRLWKHGERRFPYIQHHFPENQKVVGFR